MLHVLVVEDYPQSMLKYLVAEAEKANLEVEVSHAVDMKSAVAFLNDKKFDLISVDGKFPDSNGNLTSVGVILIEKLDTFGHNGHTVFYSGNADEVSSFRRKAESGDVEGERCVHAFHKTLTDEEENGYASEKGWAKFCVKLLQT